MTRAMVAYYTAVFAACDSELPEPIISRRLVSFRQAYHTILWPDFSLTDELPLAYLLATVGHFIKSLALPQWVTLAMWMRASIHAVISPDDTRSHWSRPRD